MELFIGITIILALMAGIKYLTTEIRRTRNIERPKNEIEQTPNNYEPENTENIGQAYQQKWLFTINEKPAYCKLQKIAKDHNMIVFAKVRLFDLVEPIKAHPKYKTNLYKIQAKHVDFVIAKNNLVAKYIIELDDNSHNTPERKERDKFVDNVLTSCGYKVLRTKEINEEEITNFLNN